MFSKTTKLLLSFSFIFCFFSSCEGEQEPYPSYLYLESASCISNYETHGSNSHKLNTAWIFAGPQTIGVYDLPHSNEVPVLLSGTQDVKVRPGFWRNGISTLPVVSPLHSDFDTTVDFNLLETDTIKPVFSYLPQVSMLLNNDFEAFNEFVPKNETVDAFIYSDGAFEGNRSAKITLDANNTIFEYGTKNQYDLSYNAIASYVELNYKCDAPFSVYLKAFAFDPNTGISTPNNIGERVITLLAKDEWNKVYIDLSETLIIFEGSQSNPEYINYELGFQAVLPDSLSTASYYFDNVKILTR